MSLGPFQIVIILLVLVVLFGRGRISDFMGDIGKGVKSFRRGLDDEGSAASRFEAAIAEAKPAEPRPAADKPAG
ncbi:MAG: hypothetical protein B7Z08_07405 [Sphingomonadales bacterium 32-68-7]|nr:MAG: hypothetical protein B7Z33_06805 [Sphingomonadales bacterium 12-68-11]OYX08901.1 MAG: hypothetical protein B7Z08_07405 [Sphingomonadales bacterium 32-68-7]